MSTNRAMAVTVACVEATLANNPAFAQVEPCFYVVRQGSAYVYVRVVPLGEGRALVRLVAQLAQGVEITPELAIKLLRLNARMRFGSFGFVRDESCVVLSHTLLGGEALDSETLLTALTHLALVADEYDDHIVAEAGGKRMQDLLNDAAVARDLGAGVAWDDD